MQPEHIKILKPATYINRKVSAHAEPPLKLNIIILRMCSKVVIVEAVTSSCLISIDVNTLNYWLFWIGVVVLNKLKQLFIGGVVGNPSLSLLDEVSVQIDRKHFDKTGGVLDVSVDV